MTKAWGTLAVLNSAVTRVTATVCFNASFLTKYIADGEQAWFSVAVAADSIISCCMIYHLWTAGKMVIGKRIANILTGLIRLTAESCLICTIANVVGLILYWTNRHTLLFLITLLMTSKLYSNCLLAVRATIVHPVLFFRIQLALRCPIGS